MSHKKSKIRGGDRSIMNTNPGGGTCCCPPACWTRSLACCGSRPGPLVSTDNYYDDYVMSSCPAGTCRCPGQSGACLPGCCGTLPGEGGGQCLSYQRGCAGQPSDDYLMNGACWCPGGSAKLPGCCDSRWVDFGTFA